MRKWCSVMQYSWMKKCGTWGSHSGENGAFGGKSLQFCGKISQLDGYFFFFLQKTHTFDDNFDHIPRKFCIFSSSSLRFLSLSQFYNILPNLESSCAWLIIMAQNKAQCSIYKKIIFIYKCICWANLAPYDLREHCCDD